MKTMTFAIIGAGAGGTLMTVHLKSLGHVVQLMDRRADLIDAIQKNGVKATGKTEGQAKPDLVTTDLSRCLAGADVVMVCTTGDAHGEIAAQAAPHLRDGQVVVLAPGQLGGVLVFRNALAQAGCRAEILLGETSDFLFACRTVEPGHSFQSGVKSRVYLATAPSKTAQRIIDIIGESFGNLVPAQSILHTSLNGGGALLHSIPCMMNMNKIELGQNFDYYMEGLTPGVCRLIEAADRERLALCAALGIESPSLLEDLKEMYGLAPDNLYEAIQSCQPYAGIKSPADTGHRFVMEDTLCDLVPTASLGTMLGIDMPIYNAFVLLAGQMLGIDFAAKGRNVEALGIAGMTAEQILDMVR